MMPSLFDSDNTNFTFASASAHADDTEVDYLAVSEAMDKTTHLGRTCMRSISTQCQFESLDAAGRVIFEKCETGGVVPTATSSAFEIKQPTMPDVPGSSAHLFHGVRPSIVVDESETRVQFRASHM